MLVLIVAIAGAICSVQSLRGLAAGAIYSRGLLVEPFASQPSWKLSASAGRCSHLLQRLVCQPLEPAAPVYWTSVVDGCRSYLLVRRPPKVMITVLLLILVSVEGSCAWV